jgi:hypothetical protein
MQEFHVGTSGRIGWSGGNQFHLGHLEAVRFSFIVGSLDSIKTTASDANGSTILDDARDHFSWFPWKCHPIADFEYRLWRFFHSHFLLHYQGDVPVLDCMCLHVNSSIARASWPQDRRQRRT